MGQGGRNSLLPSNGGPNADGGPLRRDLTLKGSSIQVILGDGLEPPHCVDDIESVDRDVMTLASLGILNTRYP